MEDASHLHGIAKTNSPIDKWSNTWHSWTHCTSEHWMTGFLQKLFITEKVSRAEISPCRNKNLGASLGTQKKKWQHQLRIVLRFKIQFRVWTIGGHESGTTFLGGHQECCNTITEARTSVKTLGALGTSWNDKLKVLQHQNADVLVHWEDWRWRTFTWQGIGSPWPPWPTSNKTFPAR